MQLSRKLMPGYQSYSLGSLCSALGIEINGRHRAAGDALATVRLFELLLEKNRILGMTPSSERQHIYSEGTPASGDVEPGDGSSEGSASDSSFVKSSNPFCCNRLYQIKIFRMLETYTLSWSYSGTICIK